VKDIGKTVFISGSIGGTRRYRVDHQAEQLRLQGVQCRVIEAMDQTFYGSFGEADVVILHRLPFSPMVQRIIWEARRQGAPVLLDLDDLIFEPAMAHQVGGYSLAQGEYQQRVFQDNLAKVRQTLMAVDGIIASTNFLAEQCRKLHPRVMVNRNTLSGALVRLSEAQNRRVTKGVTGECVLGYFSGTPTHERDFAVITGVLQTAMERHPGLRLKLVGYLEIPRELRHRDRITLAGPVPWQQLPALIKDVDINLAPLDTGNPFCHCKSEVKYIEAGILQVPTIASGTAGFREVITDGQNGFLAEDPVEWVAKIDALVSDVALRRHIGQGAYGHVRREYVPEKSSRQFVANLTALVKDIHAEGVSSRGSVSLYSGVQYLAHPATMRGRSHWYHR